MLHSAPCAALLGPLRCQNWHCVELGFTEAGGSGERIFWSRVRVKRSDWGRAATGPPPGPTVADLPLTTWKWKPRVCCWCTPPRSPSCFRCPAFDHLQPSSLVEWYVSVKLPLVVGFDPFSCAVLDLYFHNARCVRIYRHKVVSAVVHSIWRVYTDYVDEGFSPLGLSARALHYCSNL